MKQVSFDEFVQLEDMEVLEKLKQLHHFSGELYVITDLCYLPNFGSFIVDAKKIEEFVENFREMYNEAFFSTDIVIVNFKEKLVWVVFHEGKCWLTKLDNVTDIRTQ